MKKALLPGLLLLIPWSAVGQDHDYFEPVASREEIIRVSRNLDTTMVPARDSSTLKEQEETKMQLSLKAGGLISMSSDADTSIQPLAEILAEWDLAQDPRAPSMRAQVDLTALPGAAADLAFPATPEGLANFKSLEFALAIRERPFDSIAAWLYVEARFATRLQGETQARTRTARSAGGGLEFRNVGGDYLRVGLYADQRLSEDELYQPTVQVEGSVRLYEKEVGDKLVGISLVGKAILGLQYELGTRGVQRHDLVVVGIAAQVGGGK